jgi:hypothetical protein
VTAVQGLCDVARWMETSGGGSEVVDDDAESIFHARLFVVVASINLADC